MHRPPSEEAAPHWLSSAAALAVMDRLAALEATWHADHSLAQTVFTCFYLLHPQRCAPMHAGACTSHHRTRVFQELHANKQVLCLLSHCMQQPDGHAVLLSRAQQSNIRCNMNYAGPSDQDAFVSCIRSSFVAGMLTQHIMLQAGGAPGAERVLPRGARDVRHRARHGPRWLRVRGVLQAGGVALH